MERADSVSPLDFRFATPAISRKCELQTLGSGGRTNELLPYLPARNPRECAPIFSALQSTPCGVLLLAGSCPQFRGPPRSTTSLEFDRARQANLADRQRELEEALSFYQRDCAFGLRMMWHTRQGFVWLPTLGANYEPRSAQISLSSRLRGHPIRR
jgi:hypothetical protein